VGRLPAPSVPEPRTSSGLGSRKMKQRIVHALQKYLLNPPIKLMFAVGLVPPGYALLAGC
jgi:hypothetical protein